MHRKEKKLANLKSKERRHLARQKRNDKKRYRRNLKKFKKNCKRTFGAKWRPCYKKLKLQSKFNLKNRIANQKKTCYKI